MSIHSIVARVAFGAVLASASVGLASRPAASGCIPCTGGSAAVNGGFESGSLSGWTFSNSCLTGGCADAACAAAVPTAVANGCLGGGSCCCSAASVCGGLFNQVYCGGFAAQVYSGTGGVNCGGPANSFGELSQSVVLPVNYGFVSAYYAAAFQSVAGTVQFSVDILGLGGCTSQNVWSTTLSTCTAWTPCVVDLCAYVGCTVRVSARATSAGSSATWAYLDDVQVCQCPSPSPTAIASPTLTPTAGTGASTATATAGSPGASTTLPPTATRTGSPTGTPWASPTTSAGSPPATGTATRTATATAGSVVPTGTVTVTATIGTPPPSVTPSRTATASATATWTVTPAGSPPASATATATAGGASVSPAATVTPTRSGTATPTVAAVWTTTSGSPGLFFTGQNSFASDETVSLGLHVETAGEVRVEVFSRAGTLVRVLSEGNRPPGVHPVTWDGRDARGRLVASGVYTVVSTASGRTDRRKVTFYR